MPAPAITCFSGLRVLFGITLIRDIRLEVHLSPLLFPTISFRHINTPFLYYYNRKVESDELIGF